MRQGAWDAASEDVARTTERSIAREIDEELSGKPLVTEGFATALARVQKQQPKRRLLRRSALTREQTTAGYMVLQLIGQLHLLHQRGASA